MFKKSMKVEKNINQVEIPEKYFGFNRISNEKDKGCELCAKIYPDDCYIEGLNYCINCWNTVCSECFDCEKLTYNSDLNLDIDKIINFITYHYKKYIKYVEIYNSQDCIFNRLKKGLETGKAHFRLKRNLMETDKLYCDRSIYLNYGKKNPKINFQFSYIEI